MEPLVSILIPAYNAARWLRATIDSALLQTWSRTEIIIVDDGSTDETLRVARPFQSASVNVVRQENQGAAAARNKAFSLAQGDYIQWLDADDLLGAEKIARQLQALEGTDRRRTIASGQWGWFKHRPNKAVFAPSPLWTDLEPIEWLIRKWENNAQMQTASWLLGRELAQAAGAWDTRLLGDDDGEYFFRVLVQCKEIRFVQQAKVFYRMSGPNRLSFLGSSNRKIEAQFLGMKKQIAALRGIRDDERVRAACVTYLQDWLIHFYPERPDIVEEAQNLAASLGGALANPKLRWKYAWIAPLCGYRIAKRAQMALPILKEAFENRIDEWLFRMEGPTRPFAN